MQLHIDDYTANCSVLPHLVSYINFLSQSVKLLDNFNGQQTSHSSCRAVAYHVKIQLGNVQIRNVQIGNGNDQLNSEY